MEQLLQIFQEYGMDRYVAIGFGLIGVLLLTVGYRLFHVVVNVLGFIVSGMVVAGFMYYIFEPAPVMLGIIFLLSGVFGGFLGSSLYKVGVFLLSGVMACLMIYWLTKDFILMVAGAILIAIVAVWMERIFLVILTSVTGSFLIIGLLDTYTGLPHVMIVILAVVLAIAGMVLQFLTTKKKVVQEDHEEEEYVPQVVQPVEEEELYIEEIAATEEESDMDSEAFVEEEMVDIQDVVDDEIGIEEK